MPIYPSEKNAGRPPLSYQSFLKLAGQPSWASSPLPTTLNCLPPLGNVGNCEIFPGVPSVGELGYDDTPEVYDIK